MPRTELASPYVIVAVLVVENIVEAFLPGDLTRFARTRGAAYRSLDFFVQPHEAGGIRGRLVASSPIPLPDALIRAALAANLREQNSRLLNRDTFTRVRNRCEGNKHSSDQPERTLPVATAADQDFHLMDARLRDDDSKQVFLPLFQPCW